MELEQEKADEYLAIRKKFKDTSSLTINQPFEITRVLFSDIHGDIFKLDMRQGKIELQMLTLNNRVQDCFILCRLDIGENLIHKNPDGTKITGHHIHFYKQGFGDRIAKPLALFNFENPTNILECVNKFLDICNIDHSRISLQEQL